MKLPDLRKKLAPALHAQFEAAFESLLAQQRLFLLPKAIPLVLATRPSAQDLLDTATPSLRVVLAGRRNPGLRLGGWLAERRLSVVDPGELVFSFAETTDYVIGECGESPGAVVLNEVYERSEGWPGMLSLMIASLPRDATLETAVRDGLLPRRQIAANLCMWRYRGEGCGYAGGAVADAIGQRLARLAGRVQVLAVTHAPQVAARAVGHLRIAKSAAARGKRVATRVEPLAEDARREEIARMLAGATITEEARAAARRLIESAQAPVP